MYGYRNMGLGDDHLSAKSVLLFRGSACGSVLRLNAPISFWGGVNTKTSKITLRDHPQFGTRISDKILVIEKLIGSSSSSAVLLELLYNGIAPKALVLQGLDAILPIGVIVAHQMRWETIPILLYPSCPYHSGDTVEINKPGSSTLMDPIGDDLRRNRPA